MRTRSKVWVWPVIAVAVGALAPAALGAEALSADAVAAAKDELQMNLNIVWTCIAAFLVFFMQAGFAMVEAGFTRAKNAVNILMKNLMDFSIGSLAFFLVGFGLMFGKTIGLRVTEEEELKGLDIGEHGMEAYSGFHIFSTM